MNPEVAEVIASLKAQGVRVAVDPSGSHADVYELELPNGYRYNCLAAGLLKLKTEGKDSPAGIEEMGRREK